MPWSEAEFQSSMPIIEELFPGAADFYLQYLDVFGPTFSEHWLTQKEWQVLLPQALEQECPITDATIQVYMDLYHSFMTR